MTDQVTNPFRARLIRIVEPGWETFSEVFGTVTFKDGVSIQPVPWLEQQRLGGILRIESAEEDEVEIRIGPSAELVRVRSMDADDERVTNMDKTVTVDGEVRLAVANYSRPELEDIADRKGLAGLRDVAAAWGVKGRSVNDLINGILEAQTGNAAPVGKD